MIVSTGAISVAKYVSVRVSIASGSAVLFLHRILLYCNILNLLVWFIPISGKDSMVNPIGPRNLLKHAF